MSFAADQKEVILTLWIGRRSSIHWCLILDRETSNCGKIRSRGGQASRSLKSRFEPLADGPFIPGLFFTQVHPRIALDFKRVSISKGSTQAIRIEPRDI